MSRQQVLLLKDINEERAGEVTKVRAGFARNYLYPKGIAVKATKHAIRMQEALRVERAKQTEVDRKDAQLKADSVKDTVVETNVKVGPDGRMYGSVSAADVSEMLLEQSGLEIGKKQIVLPHVIKSTGVHEVTILFREGVTVTIQVKVIPEGGIPEAEEAAEGEEDAATDEEAPDTESENG